ncbi:MAG TPA: heavy metal translocating P-type ATPase, partial [Balneolaceae bacterium]|nr:heavy metal translocating P-type ATPase [Balneolaceae bacterium]
QSIHPLSKKIYNKLEIRDTITPDQFDEIPGKGIISLISGTSVAIGSRSFLIQQEGLTNEDIPATNESGSMVHICIDGYYKGYFTFENRVRKGLKTLLEDLERENHEAYLLSGDNSFEENKLRNVFSNWKKMLFNQSPVQKLNVIEGLKNEGKHVVMIGDGLNDAGALQASNFGIAISDDMSSFSPACDAIAEGGSLENMHTLLKFSRASFRIIIASFVISLIYNITGLGFAVTGHLSPLVAAILMPLSSVSVMAFTYTVTRIKARKMGLKIWA